MEQREKQPEKIGKYLVHGTLGRGSSGLVYKAQDPGIGRFVAIKTIQAALVSDGGRAEGSGAGLDADAGGAAGATRSISTEAGDARAQLVERLRAEARAAGNLRHPNIVTIFEVGEDYETPYLVMDYVEGETLGQLIQRRGSLSIPEVMKILWLVASALDYAHDKGVLHKDIKPANILIDRAGQVMLLDFGIAAISSSLSEGPGAVALGTPAYMSPEQLLNETVTHRSDLFSLAIVAFELFTGRRAFTGDSFHEVVGNILNGRKLSLVESNSGLPLALEAEFEIALATAPEGRFGSAQVMIEAFSKALGVDVVVRSSSVMMPTVEPRDFEAPKKRDSKAISGRLVSPSSGGFMGPRTNEDLFGDALVVGSNAGGVRRGLSTAGILLVFCCVAAVALGLALLIARPQILTAMLGGNAPQNSEQSAANTDNLGANTDDGNGLVVPPSDPAPSDRPTADFTDRQVIGVIMNLQAPEALVKEAIDEAEVRKLGGLADALVYPLRHDGYAVRIRALEVLAKLGDRRVVPSVMQALDDHDPLVRGYAARCLAALGDKRALPYLQARLASETVLEVKESLRRAVDRLNGFSIKDK